METDPTRSTPLALDLVRVVCSESPVLAVELLDSLSQQFTAAQAALGLAQHRGDAAGAAECARGLMHPASSIGATQLVGMLNAFAVSRGDARGYECLRGEIDRCLEFVLDARAKLAAALAGDLPPLRLAE